MSEDFNWKQYWKKYWNEKRGKDKRRRLKDKRKADTKAKEALKRFYLKNPDLKPGQLDPEFPRTEYIEITLSHWLAFALCDEQSHYNNKCSRIYRHITTPEIRYELKDKEIIRTISTFHYLSKETKVNGLCRSFTNLWKERNGEITGNDEVFNIPNSILEEFRERYFVKKIKEIDLSNSDLDFEIKCFKVRINRNFYFIVMVRDLFGGTWGTPRMFRSGHCHGTELNNKIELKLKQEEIIEKIKSGEITKINEYGNPKKIYSKGELLNLLG